MNPNAIVIHVYHISLDPSSPFQLDTPGLEIQEYARPSHGEHIISKQQNSAFVGTNLEDMLRQMKVDRLCIAGLTTDHCVSTTVRTAANLGVVNHFNDTGEQVKGRIILVEDAVATFKRGGFDAETVHQVHVESLKGEFCEVMRTAEVVDILHRKFVCVSSGR